MTRKDYEKIARTIRTLPIDFWDKCKVCEEFVSMLFIENPRFRADKFRTACGCDSESQNHERDMERHLQWEEDAAKYY